MRIPIALLSSITIIRWRIEANQLSALQPHKPCAYGLVFPLPCICESRPLQDKPQRCAQINQGCRGCGYRVRLRWVAGWTCAIVAGDPDGW